MTPSNIDCEDFECVGKADCEGTDALCSDGKDNDGNGYTDCDDHICSQNCDTADVCTNEENTLTKCTDGADNDGDTYIDCEDYGCSKNVCDAVRDLCSE